MTELNIGAQVQIAQAAAPVGEIAELTGDVFITRATGETVQATVGTPVFQNDTFETGPGAGVGIDFADDSAFSLGADARLTIDEFVYNPAGDSGMAMNLVQGAFSFVSGQIAKSGDNNMTIVTPTATIGVRGTAGAGDEDEAVLLQEPGQPLGEMTVTTPGGSVTLNSINAYTNTSDPFAPPTPPEFRPLDQIQAQFGGAIRELPGFTPSDQEGAGGEGGEGGEGEAGQGETGDADTEANGEGTAEDGPDGEGEAGGDPNDPQGAPGDPDGLEEGDPEEDVLLDGPADEQLGGDGLGTEGVGLGGEEGLEGDGLAGDGLGPDDVIDGQEGSLAGGDFDNAQDDFFDGISEGAEQQAGGAGDDGLLGGGDGDDVLEGGLGGGDGLFGGGGEDDFGGPDGDDLFGGPDDDFNPGELPPDDDLDDELETGDPIVVSFNSDDGSPSHTLTPGVSDTVIFDDSVTVNVVGLAEGSDLFVGNPSSNNQNLQIQDAGPHSITTTDIDRIDFVSSLLSSDELNIQILGTDSVVIDGPGDFNGTVISGNESKSINIGVSFASATGTVFMAGLNDTLNLRANSADVQVSGVENLDGSTANETVTVLDSLLSGSDYNGQAGTDELKLTDGTSNTASITNFETISASTASGVSLTLENSGTFNFDFTGSGTDTVNFDVGNDTITAQGVENINAGAGTDSLVIADSGAAQTVTVTGFVAAAETITGSAQDDTVRIADSATPTINLLGGIDEVQNVSGGSLVGLQLSNVDRYVGNGSVDDITSQTQFFGSGVNVYDGGGGADSLTLSAGTNILSILNFETVTGSAGAENLTLEAALGVGGTTIDLLGGADTLTLANGSNDLVVSNIEILTGGGDDDTVAVQNVLTGAAVNTYDGGGGTDILTLAAGANILSAVNFETINGSGATDNLTLESSLTGGTSTVNLQAGTDTLNLSAGGNNLRVVGIETVVGGSGDDIVKLNDATNVNLNLNAGNDSVINFGDLGLAAVFLTSVESYSGGSSFEVVTLLDNAQTGSSYDGGGGAGDVLFLNGGVNDGSFVDFDRIVGSGIGDTLTLEAVIAATFATDFEMGSGNDVLTLANGTNVLDVEDLETLNGSTGDDSVTLLNTLAASSVYDGGAGNDTLNLVGGTNVSSILNFEEVNGTAGTDDLTLENVVTGGTTIIDLKAGADTLTLADGANDLQTIDVETIIGGTGDDTLTHKLGLNSDINLGAGNDTVNNIETVATTLTLSNVETYNGSGVNDTVQVGTALLPGSTYFGGAGTDQLTLFAAAANTVAVDGFETVIGGANVDTVTNTGTTDVTFNLGIGADVVINNGVGVAETFVYTSIADDDGGVESISRFETGIDKIDLSSLGLSTAAPFVQGVSSFVGGSQASAFFEGDGSDILIDTDGDTNVDISINIGTLVGTLTDADFVL